MSTCIPLFFKPIKYNNKYYVDGGILCIMPFIDKYKNYLGIYIKEDKSKKIDNMDLFEYFTYLNSCLTNTCKFKTTDKNEHKIIYINTLFLPCINFDICQENKDILKKSGYDQTINHIKKFDLLIK